MYCYNFDPETKEFTHAELCNVDPLETKLAGHDVFLLPANATFVTPPEPQEGYAIVWNGEAWRYVEDYRGKEYWPAGSPWYASPEEVKELGPLPEGASLVKPERSFEEERQAALSTVDGATSEAIMQGFDYEVPSELFGGTGVSETLHFSYDSFDQQNFADTANMAMLLMSGAAPASDGSISSVTWNGWRGWTPENKGTLVRITFDIPSYLALYTQGALVHKATQMEIGGQRKVLVEACESKAEISALLQEWGLL